jgi:hypothetical protein
MDTERLRWWIMGFGPRAVVQGPRGLRDDIARQHRTAAETYMNTIPASARGKG